MGVSRGGDPGEPQSKKGIGTTRGFARYVQCKESS